MHTFRSASNAADALIASFERKSASRNHTGRPTTLEPVQEMEYSAYGGLPDQNIVGSDPASSKYTYHN